MRRLKLLGLMALALFAFGAMSASAAFATEEEPPEILCLSGGVATTCEKLVGTFTGGASTLFDLLSAGLSLVGTGVTATIDTKNCKLNGAAKADFSLCTDIPIDFTGVKTGKVACRSEATNGTDKDAIETVLVLADLHLAAELTSAKVLQPLLLAKVLGPLLENELTINCGGVKTVVRGTALCLLLPGLKAIPAESEIVEILCKVNTTTRDPETGTCNVLCNWEKEFPLESTLGKEFMDAAFLVHLKGKFNKEIFIDD